jgi:hypothetical protein
MSVSRAPSNTKPRRPRNAERQQFENIDLAGRATSNAAWGRRGNLRLFQLGTLLWDRHLV